MVCLSFANLSFVRIWEGTLAYTRSDAFYMLRLPSPADILACLTCVVIFAALLWTVVTLARRYLSVLAFRILRVSGLAMLVLPLNSLRLSAAVTKNFDLVGFLSSRSVLLSLAVVLPLVAWMCWKWQRVMVRAAMTVFLVTFAFTVLTFAESVTAIATFSGRVHDNPPAPRLAAAPDAHRVVWIIFDEWDYGLTFERRPQNLQLPAIDRFRSEALAASNAEAPTLQTTTSVPAMLMGRIPKTPADRRDWSTTVTLFSAARQEGINTAIVGWYLPYCRIFSSLVTDCAWWPLPNALNSNGDTFAEKVTNDAMSLIETGARGVLRQPAAMRYKSRKFEEFLRRAEAGVSDPSLGLIFLHVPIPHPPHPYNRATGRFDVKNSRKTGYFDSLALVDRMVAGLRAKMEQNGLWDRTAVLLSADHPLREPIGPFDPRVPFLLKFPHDTTSVEYAPHLRTIVTADLLLSILRGEISRRDQALAWIGRHHEDTEVPIEAHRRKLPEN